MQDSKQIEKNIEQEIEEAKDLERNEIAVLEENKMQNQESDSSSQNIPDTNDARYVKIGMFVLFTVFVVLGIWSATAELDTGVPCSGQVVVESNKKTIQSLEGGIIKEIYVKDGDKVEKGDNLIRFDTTRSQSELDSLSANYYETIALRDRLIAENRGKKEISFSKELDILADDKKEKIKARQNDIFKHETAYIRKQEISTNKKIQSLRNRIESSQQNIEKQNSLLASYKNEVSEQEDLLAQGLVDKNKLIDARRKITSIENDILKSQSEIEKNQIEIESAKNDLELTNEKFFTDVNTKLSQAQASVSEMEAKMINLKDRLSQTVLNSPVKGVVMGLVYHTIGAVVTPGKPIMDIVPEDANLIIEAKFLPSFIEYVKVGEKAKLSFPAFAMDSQFLDNVEGEVIFVSADTTTNENGETFYTVKVEVDEEGKKILEENNLKLLSGMPASATVIAGSQTTLEYLFKPMSKMLEKAFLEK